MYLTLEKCQVETLLLLYKWLSHFLDWEVCFSSVFLFLFFPADTLCTQELFYLYNIKLFQPSWVLKAASFFHWQFTSPVAVRWQVIFKGVVGARATVAFLNVPRSDCIQLYQWLSPLFSSYPVPVPEGPCRGAEGIHEPWTLRYFAFWRTQWGKISLLADLEVTLFHADHLTMQISWQLIQT